MELPPNLVPLWPTAVVRDFGGSRGGGLNCEKTPGDIDTVESELRLVGLFAVRLGSVVGRCPR